MDELIASSLRMATPLLFAAMGGVLAERAGIATICLEGALILAAWVAAVLNFHTSNPWIGAIGALAAGAFALGLHSLLVQSGKTGAIVSGVAVNFFCAGLPPVLNKAIYGSPTNTPSIPMDVRFSNWTIPYLSDIPFLGRALFDHKPLVYLALLLPFGIHYFLHKTGPGLRLWAAGDGAEALRAAGRSVVRVRWWALLLGGAVCSLGGTFLSISHASQFTRDMTAGRGFIALAAVIFGKWKPLPAAAACLLFGLVDSLQIRLQSSELLGGNFPVQFVQVFPYVVTLVVLLGWVGGAKPPKAIVEEN